MKSLKTIVVSSFSLLTVILLINFRIWHNEIKKEVISIDPEVKYEANPDNKKEPGRSVRFEPNVGQTNIPASFIAHGKGYQLLLTSNEAVLVFQNTVNRMQLEGSNENPVVRGCGELAGKTNYIIGNDRTKWFSGIPNYASVEYKEIYPGIDLVYYGNEGELEYDFIVAPGSNPYDIQLKFEKHKKPEISKDGSLVISGGGAELILKPPFAYQKKEGRRDSVFVEYTIRNDSLIGFNTANYDPGLALVIDPVLSYSTYLGTDESESAEAIAVDAEGCAYITGSTYSSYFPVKNYFQGAIAPGDFLCTDAFVTKFNATGTDIVYSTYLGGSSDDSGASIAVDAGGRVYMTGRTTSKDKVSTPGDEGFPLKNEYQGTLGGYSLSDAFVSVLSASGSSLLYSSYLGGDGEDYGTGISVGDNRYFYVTGTEFSFDFPVKNAYMRDKPSYYFDAFVAKFDSFLEYEASLVYSTHLGGTGDDYVNSIAVDREGCAYVTGETYASDFPVTSNAIQKNKKANRDAFVTKFSSNGLTLAYSTYLGSDASDRSIEIVVDKEGYAYINGFAGKDFPTTPGTFNPADGYNFLCKILPGGEGFAYSTHTPAAGCLAVDDLGKAYMGRLGDVNAYIAAFNQEGSDTLFTLKLSGNGSNSIKDIAVDKSHSIYICGSTNSTNIATAGAYKTNLSGSYDIMVAKFSSITTDIPADPMPINLSGLHLNPVYPSPFNSQATMRLGLTFNSRVTLTVYDEYGRKVITLLDKYMLSGEYTETWDGVDSNGIRVPAGVYICVLTDGKIKLSQKVVVAE